MIQRHTYLFMFPLPEAHSLHAFTLLCYATQTTTKSLRLHLNAINQITECRARDLI